MSALPLRSSSSNDAAGPGDGRLPQLLETSIDGPRRCDWCRRQLPDTAGPSTRFCGQAHRQAAWRVRRQHQVQRRSARPLRLAYADPPYPGLARLYRGEASYAGEVDHAELIASLVDRYDGWALSTGAYALRDVLPLCPRGARVCAWVKPIGANPATLGLHNCWEAVIVVPGRRLRGGKRDWLAAQPARGGGDLLGRKPLAFCAWLFELLGALPGDTIEDLFPGTGVVARAWREVSRAAAADGGGFNHRATETTERRNITPENG